MAKPRKKKPRPKPKKKVKTRAKAPARSAKRRAPAKKKPASKPKAKAKTKPKTKTKTKTEPEATIASVAEQTWQASSESEEIGELEIPSGKVKVSDAGTLFAPVEVAIPKGTWRVRITRKEGENLGAVLYQPNATPIAWTERGAYAVDAGMSGFFDSAVFARIDKHVWPISIYDDLISKHLDPAEGEGHAGAFVPFEDTKFSACRSGYGDGVYPVYAGTNASGAIVMIVTKFID